MLVYRALLAFFVDHNMNVRTYKDFLCRRYSLSTLYLAVEVSQFNSFNLNSIF